MDTGIISIASLKGRVVENAIRVESDPERLFKLGLQCLKQHLLPEAKLALGRAYKLRLSEPRYSSYYGLLLALVDNELECALQLCESAVVRNFLHADLFCNLGRVYLLAGMKGNAYQAFTNGLKVDSDNRDLIVELKKMGSRKMPVFPFFKRDNALNYIAGKIFHRFMGTKKAAEPDAQQTFHDRQVCNLGKKYDFAGHPQLKFKSGAKKAAR